MKKQCVVITGGNSGLGLELVKLFKKDYQVVSISRTKKKEVCSLPICPHSQQYSKFIPLPSLEPNFSGFQNI